MNYYIQETVFDDVVKKTAGSKAREDINEIAEKMGFTPIEVEYDYSLRNKKGFLTALAQLSEDWSKALAQVGEGDTVLIQYPLNHHPVGVPGMLKKLQKRGGKVIILIHDIDYIRMNQNKTPLDKLKIAKVKYEDHATIKCGDAVIAHNRKMMKFLLGMGVEREKMISLRIFDYLIHQGFVYVSRDMGEPVIVAGNLRKHKVGYVYSLPGNQEFNLYGVGFEDDGRENVHYLGALDPEELTQKMQGSFGLVWDGTTCDTCDGLSGNYLKINNPHKFSLYLSSGLPVIVWDQAAVADFVNKEKVGITVSRISEIHDAVANMSETSYREMEANARKISRRLIGGSYTKKALTRALDMVSGQKD